MSYHVKGCEPVSMTFEQRVEERIERQIKLAEESNRLLMCQALAMERIAKALENWPNKEVQYVGIRRAHG